ncbi:hypothetical protein NNJEOMEG_00227 [Fundidesulfovibrio magnetotacticus]|uniref:FlxA-like protein n=1 Tax=Fundidesulfovibrio magnetotacticus TaxID=2730080 RepID=A0A6V8LI45_9BACT|nr:FlxA-like family protein [Fundidesulfovibrio magnetotacticus]GFK92402.1 hypothetical protein NNJEOMEG_00227 [Fundidesulfovibrio magnetotacticus]
MNIASTLLSADKTLSPLGGTLKTGAQDAAQGASGTATAQGDTVSLSEAGKQEAAKLTTKAGKSDKTSVESQIESLKDQIEKLKEQMDKIKNGDLPEKQKQQQIMMLQNQMIQLNDQLAKLQQQANGGVTGGTSAQGFASSLT